jgi:hypothetical protein
MLATPIDLDPIDVTRPVIMSGFVKTPGPESPFPHPAMEVRVGITLGLVQDPPSFSSPMIDLDVPSLPGMSGGPVYVERLVPGRGVLATVVGIVSCQKLAAAPHDGTWVTPIEYLYSVRFPGGTAESPQDLFFGDLVRNGMVNSVGSRALRARLVLGGLKNSTGAPVTFD